jgi:hypothetical protein
VDDALFEEISDLEMTLPAETKAEHFQRLADDEVAAGPRRVALLAAAGDHWQLRGEYGRARECFEAMPAAGDDDELPAAAHLLVLALETGDHERADLLDRELRQLSTERHLGTAYAFVAESYEEAGRLRDAVRWFSLANADVDPDDLGALDVVAVIGRARARRALGLPRDRYDHAATTLRGDTSPG